MISPYFDGKLYKVKEGTGMGLKHSGELADAALAALCEVTFALKGKVKAGYKIERYWRYRDDILVLGEDEKKMESFCRTMSRLSKYFILEPDEVKYDCVDFLQLKITKQPAQFECEQKFKVTSLGMPLCSTSGHPPHTLSAWPVAFTKAIGSCSTTVAAAYRAKHTFLDRFVQHHSDQKTCDLIASTEPFN